MGESVASGSGNSTVQGMWNIYVVGYRNDQAGRLGTKEKTPISG
jgi:hypothetical protein